MIVLPRDPLPLLPVTYLDLTRIDFLEPIKPGLVLHLGCASSDGTEPEYTVYWLQR
jgi:hypothetical protein